MDGPAGFSDLQSEGDGTVLEPRGSVSLFALSLEKAVE
jgi:hypothetical protein